jgi:hypothetical protein
MYIYSLNYGHDGHSALGNVNPFLAASIEKSSISILPKEIPE